MSGLTDKISAIFERLKCELDEASILSADLGTVVRHLHAQQASESALSEVLTAIAEHEAGIRVEILTHEQAACDFARMGVEYPFKKP